MGRNSSWLDRPAVKWDPAFLGDYEQSESFSSSCYWDRELIALLSSLHDNHARSHGDGYSFSYGSLLIAAISIARSLRQSYLHHSVDVVAPETSREQVQVAASVVVAIPEGPLLPIAVLALHLLNQPWTNDDNASSHSSSAASATSTSGATTTTPSFAVLVPLEPGEGKERIAHMLTDLRPILILCLAGKDRNRLTEILESIEPSAMKNATLSAEGLIQLPRAEVVEFGDLLRTTIHSTAIEEREKIRDYFQTHDGGHPRGGLLQDLSNYSCFYSHDEYQRSSSSFYPSSDDNHNRISHIVFTSGTTGMPKGCISSIRSLRHYLAAKNQAHGITSESIVLLASALSFDPCISDILATVQARATLVISSRPVLVQSLSLLLQHQNVTHVLCTPTLWGMMAVVPQCSSSADGDALCNVVRTLPSEIFPSLQVVALGGEVIPNHIVKAWARRKPSTADDDDDATCSQPCPLRLCATYGVTEACVYQSFGEVWWDENHDGCDLGQNVGKPLRGLSVRICDEKEQSALNNVDGAHVRKEEQGLPLGEIVLSGMQIDEYSGYLNNKQQSDAKFVKDLALDCFYYRTGDRGFVNPVTDELHVLGRIHGEDGMVKVNGVRVELGEVENALVDGAIILNCLAAVVETNGRSKQIHAFCVLSRRCLCEISLDGAVAAESGIILTPGPLLVLLQARCMNRLRAGVIPSSFVVIERLPLSPTGKSDRRGLAPLSDCVPMESVPLLSDDGAPSVPLWEYGSSGATVAAHVVDCLNLQPCQQSLLAASISFGMLGGDSLAATRLTRSLYAHHYGVYNSRFLGGSYGVLEGAFEASHLLRARTMGEYVDWLDTHDVCGSIQGTNGKKKTSVIGSNITTNVPVIDTETQDTSPNAHVNDNREDDLSFRLYEALLGAATSGHSSIACALLDHGVDPNLRQHVGRLAKTSGTLDRKRVFRSNPLHLACSKGDSVLVKKLLENGCKFNSPDASGSFPIHLAASSTVSSGTDYSPTIENNVNERDEDERRRDCVQFLLDAGAPLTMKDGNKQTVLHCAARAGHCKLLSFLMKRWTCLIVHNGRSAFRASPFDWTDHWFRTPVDWAILNGKVEALKILLDDGCSPNPYKPKNGKRQTSVAIESPLELCDRLYGGDSDTTGRQMRELLLRAASIEANRERKANF